MSSVLYGNQIKELCYEDNISYLLENESLFQTTEYKVLCHQRNSVFVETSKMILNGKIQIYYFTSKYIPLNMELKDAQLADLLAVLERIYSSLLEIKKIGFLSLKNIVTEIDHVFVNPDTNSIKWIYLPISNELNKSEAICENEMLSSLKRQLKKLLSVKEGEVLDEILLEGFSIEQTLARVKNRTILSVCKEQRKNNHLQLIIQARDEKNPLRLIDNKDEYLIGRKASAVDGVIVSSKLVGRVHCKIIRNNFGFSVADLQSTNGTFVNGERVHPNTVATLSDGDILRLANEEFLIKVEETESVQA